MDLSILIPARNEMFLARTIEDVLKNMRGKTEIIAVCDGGWPDPPINDHPMVNLIYFSVSVGQRAAVNYAASMSRAKYVMKIDAHCAFDEGFDIKLMADMQDNWTMVPIMRNLWAFDWQCKKCGNRRYQGPTPTSCPKCDNIDSFERVIVWKGKDNPQSTSYCFDSEPHFQYFGKFKKRLDGAGDLTDTMSIQGSCFLVTREKFWELELCDESFGSWGSQGIEVAVKTWLSGGRVVCNHKTWYAHMFRTQGGDFGFPYQISGRQTQAAKRKARDIFFNNKWPKQIYPLSWLVEKFWPIPGWKQEELDDLKRKDGTLSLPSRAVPTKGLVYYTDNNCEESICNAVRKQLIKCNNGYQLISVSLKPIDFGDNHVMPLDRGVLTMFRQILLGLKICEADIIFFVEHDVLYHPSHFDFIPPRKDTIYYNQNVWKVDAKTGQALFYYVNQTSGLCAYRDLLIEHYTRRVERVEKNGFTRSIGFEPGTRSVRRGGIDDLPHDTWMSEFPNIDVRHGSNLTWSRWKKEQFRNQKYTEGWTMADEVPGWGQTKDKFQDILDGVLNG